MNPRPFDHAEVEAIFRAYPVRLRQKLLFLRQLIFEAALATDGVGALEETLKWGQPSYVTAETGSGSTIRIDHVKSSSTRYAMYFHCQTDLVATFRELYGRKMTFGGDRSVLFEERDEIPVEAVRHCVSLALTYHLRRMKVHTR
jgi:Domain of unknown function (DU1801)